MKIQVVSEDITNELKRTNELLCKKLEPNGMVSEFAQRLADVEARMQKIERCLLKTTTAGKLVASDEGKDVAKLWYQRQ